MQRLCYWLVTGAAVLSLCVSAVASDPNARGDIQGVTLNLSGQPLPNATVTVHSVDEKSDRTVTCGGDGAFAIEHLRPGKYELTAKTEKFVSPNAAVVDLQAGGVAKVEMPLVELHPAAEQPGGSPLTDREKQLLERIDRLEARLAAVEARDARATKQMAAGTTPASDF